MYPPIIKSACDSAVNKIEDHQKQKTLALPEHHETAYTDLETHQPYSVIAVGKTSLQGLPASNSILTTFNQFVKRFFIDLS
jgi:hypothetical protein